MKTRKAKVIRRCTLTSRADDDERPNDCGQADLNEVALRLNQRPRKTLGFETPASKLQASVASTGELAPGFRESRLRQHMPWVQFRYDRHRHIVVPSSGAERVRSDSTERVQVISASLDGTADLLSCAERRVCDIHRSRMEHS